MQIMCSPGSGSHDSAVPEMPDIQTSPLIFNRRFIANPPQTDRFGRSVGDPYLNTPPHIEGWERILKCLVNACQTLTENSNFKYLFRISSSQDGKYKYSTHSPSPSPLPKAKTTSTQACSPTRLRPQHAHRPSARAWSSSVRSSCQRQSNENRKG